LRLPDFPTKFILSALDEEDLIYEGIATTNHDAPLGGHHKDEEDLIYEGIATWGLISTVPTTLVTTKKT